MKLSYHMGGMIDKPFEEVTQHLSAIGYDAAEVMAGPKAHLNPETLTDSGRREIKAVLDHCHLAAAAVNPYTVSALAPMQKAGEAEAFFKRLLDLAVDLGAPTVNFLSGAIPEGDAESLKTVIEALRRIMPYAESVGKYISIHNHEGMCVDGPEKVLLLIDTIGSPNLKLTFDATNFHILHCSIPETALQLAPYIVHCHVKGVVGMYPDNKFLVPGEEGDEFNFRELASAFGEIGYQECISVETFSWMREDKAQIAYDMISKTLAELGLRGGQG